MRALFSQSPIALQSAHWGPALIGAGLGLLLIAAWSAMVPVVTAMAVVVLGATLTTISRPIAAGALETAIAIHLFVYTSLYLLFIGAVCHAAMTGPQDGLTILQGLDFGASVVPLVLAVRLSLSAITRANPS